MISKLSYEFTVREGYEILFPFGIKKMRFRSKNNIKANFFGLINTVDYNDFEFPVINGKSPNYFKFKLVEGVTGSGVAVLIEEIGGVPDPSYFGDELTQEKIDKLRDAYNELINGVEG